MNEGRDHSARACTVRRDGLWNFAGRRRAVYARSNMSVKERSEAVQRLIAREERRHARPPANDDNPAADFDEVV